MNKLTFKQVIIYFLTILILFGIPIYTIIINTNTLKGGIEYLFKVEAFDPYDMFRGNYLNINFQENSIPADNVNIEGSNKNEYYFTQILIKHNIVILYFIIVYSSLSFLFRISAALQVPISNSAHILHTVFHILGYPKLTEATFYLLYIYSQMEGTL